MSPHIGVLFPPAVRLRTGGVGATQNGSDGSYLIGGQGGLALVAHITGAAEKVRWLLRWWRW